MSNFNIPPALWTVGFTPTKCDPNNGKIGNDLVRERLRGGGSHRRDAGDGSIGVIHGYVVCLRFSGYVVQKMLWNGDEPFILACQVNQNLGPTPIPWIFNISWIGCSTGSKGFCQASFGEWDTASSTTWKNEVPRCHR